MQNKNDAKQIMKKLINNGYEAYLVGGSVRDMLLELEPKDYDITTNATPTEIESIFEYTIPTGKDYGVMTVMINDEGYEVASYRAESDYDGRRPKVISFSKTLKEDLSRRDFTINAMAMNVNGDIIDPFNGQRDLKDRLIKCVGLPEDRFKEDKLRILRAIRFSCKYDFYIDTNIFKAVWKENDISHLSQERIRDELDKMLLSQAPSMGIELMESLGILKQIMPELQECVGFNQNNSNHNKDVFEHTMVALDNVDPILELRLSALFHDIGKPLTYTEDENGTGHFYSHHKESARLTREIMTRLKYSNKEIEDVSELVYNHMSRYSFMRLSSVKKFINRVTVERLDNLFKLMVADISASKPPFDFESVYRLKFECERILKEKQPLTVKDLNINGKDLMELGYCQGKELGSELKRLLELVLDNPDLNKKEKLIKLTTKVERR